VLCIDPLFFPIIEQRLSAKFVFLERFLWGAVFAVTLLWAWNIGPGTYSFYLHEALPYTPRIILAEVGFVVAILIWFALVRGIPQRMGRWRTWACSVGIFLIVLKCFVVAGIVDAPSVRQHIKSPVLWSGRFLYSSIGAKPDKITETPGNTFYSFVKRKDPLPSQVVLMIVESWAETQSTLAAIASDIKSRDFRSVEYGFASYRGSTLSGEFRELCSKYVQPSDELIGDMRNLQCAPQYLHDKGYQVVGVHGYQPLFYARSTFWKRFGIENQMFGDKFQNQPQCPGPFPGVCDENLIRTSIDILDNSKKPAFVYILTLSSHEPIDPVALDHRGKYFNEIKIVNPSQIVARRAFSALVSRLEERRGSGCTLVYIAGDHQPPSASARGGIFEPGKIPYLSFTQNCLPSQE
jgi:hypothetical protein